MEYNIIYKCLFKVCVLGICVWSEGGTKIKHLFYYDGHGEAKLVCNGSDVINITDYELINHPTDCSKAKCDLTHEDRNSIEACDGTSTCVIPINDMSSCLKDKGFFRIDYTCQGIALNCDFEHGSCGWAIGRSGWRIVESSNSRYLFVQTNNTYRKVKSDRIAGNERQCLSLHYYIRYRLFSDDYIIIYRQYMNGTVIDKNEFGPVSVVDDWDYLEIPIFDAGDFELVIEARGHFYRSAFGVDDIRITNTECGKSEVSEQIPHTLTCKIVDETVSLNGCYSDYLSLSTVSFNPSKGHCNNYLQEEATSVCRASDYVTHCDLTMFVRQNPSCINLNTLKIEYTCTGTFISNEPDNTGMAVGVFIGGLLIVGLIGSAAWIIIRRRNCNQKGQTRREINVSARWHAYGQEEHVNSAVQLNTKNVPTGNVLANDISTNQPLEDEYAESGAGVYDISGNSRHKVKDTIYDHSVEDTYDTSNNGRHKDLGDYTYNHV